MIPEELVNIMHCNIGDRANAPTQAAGLRNRDVAPTISGEKTTNSPIVNGGFDHGITVFETENIAGHEIHVGIAARPVDGVGIVQRSRQWLLDKEMAALPGSGDGWFTV